MATRVLTRSRLTCTKQTLDSIFTRPFSSLPLAKPPQTALSPTPSLLWLRPVLAVAAGLRNVSPPVGSARGFATRQTTSSLNDPNPNWSNRPPKETILLDGCDFEHWLVVVEKPDDNMTRDQVIDGYIKLLAQVVGSEEEARMKIYSVSTKHYFAFGALVSEELSYKIKELPGVRWVLPDSYLDVKNKDYGGEPFINGQAVPYDPKYHEEWVRNNERSRERGNRNKPRNRDSRTYERRREMDMHRQNVQNTGGVTFPGGPQNMGPNNPGYAPPNSMGGGVLANNMGGMTPNTSPNHQYGNTPYSRGAPYQSGPQPNQSSYAPNTASGNPQSSNMTGMPNNAQYGGAPHQSGPGPNQNSSVPNVGVGTGNPYQNMGGMTPNNSPNHQYGNTPYSSRAPYQSGPQPNQSSYAPNTASGNPQSSNMTGMPNNAQYGGAPHQSGPGPNQNSSVPNVGVETGNPYRNQNLPGRDIPPPQNY